MSSYLPPSPNPIFNSKSFNTNDILININGLTTSARAYIDEKIEDISGDITDLSGIIITIIEDIESNTAQIQTNVSAISIIGGEIDTLETNVVDLSSQVLDLSTNTAKLNVANTFTANNTFTNYITTPKVEITTEPVDLSDATTKNYVDTAIAGVVFDDTSFARLDISNTFVSTQIFLDTINAEKVVADKFFTDNNGEELVYGNYSNTFYVNDNETGTSGSINDTLALITSQDKIIRVSLGSYGEDVLVSGKTLLGISCPNVGGVTMTELGETNTFTIDNSLRVRVSGLQINGMTTISGSQFKHRLEVCNFNGGLTITGGGVTPLAEFMTIQDCDVSGSLTISSFTGIIYFYRVDFQNATFNISPDFSPQQVIMIDCRNIPDDASLFAGNYFVVGLTSYYKNGDLKLTDLNPAYYVRDTSPSQDNELASKFYVDLGVNANASSISNNTAIIAVNSTAISQLQGLLTATEANVATNTANISTNTNNISTNTSDIATKQDTLIAGTGIEIVGATISATGGGGGGSSIEIFQASMVRNNGTTALSNNDNLPFAIIDKETSGLTMSASNGEVTFGGSNVAGTYEIKYSIVLTNTASTTNRVIVRGYVNNVWVVEFGKLSGFLENGGFTYDFASGDVLRFTIIGLQGSNQLLLATGLTTETYASCFLTGIKLI